MKKLFRNHPDVILAVLALFFSIIIIGTFIWGIGDVVAAMNSALNFTPNATNPGFDLSGASKLDLRGLTP